MIRRVHIAVLAVTALTLAGGQAPALAQEVEEENGFSLMEEGAKLFLEGILREVEPSLGDLQRAKGLLPRSCACQALAWGVGGTPSRA